MTLLGRVRLGLKAAGFKTGVLGFGATLVLSQALASVAVAADAIKQFEQFVQTVPAATGRFSQYTIGPQGQTAKPQTGVFYFSRPGKFRWDVQKPYAQLVLSDGKSVYQYDPDLSQATVRAVGAAISSSPAAILFGQGKLLDGFVVTPLPDDDGLSWFRAVPKQPDAGLNQVDIGMLQGNPARLLLVDGFGQTTRVDFERLRAQSDFAPGTFSFTPPPGTQVVKVN
jgi:outer membrane lipoprotein carrier protein